MKRIFVLLVVLQAIILLVWYGWNGNAPSNYQLSRVRMDIIASINNQDADGRYFRSVLLTVGKQQGIFNFYVYKPSDIANRATILFNGCAHSGKDSNRIELVTGFIDYVRGKDYQKTIAYLSKNANASNDIFNARQMEVIGVLQDNLKHPSVGRIHVLVWFKETADYIRSLPLKNSEKLVLRVMGKDVGVKEGLLYASECLNGKIVAIAHQDNKLGNGWDNTAYHSILKENNIMYALTRHSPVESNCTWVKDITVCDDGVRYIGSHDMFVFRAKKWNADVFNEMGSVTPERQGMENLLIWLFKTKLKYRIINPCKRLFVHHHHCVAIRSWRQPRVDSDGKSLCAEFTDKLI